MTAYKVLSLLDLFSVDRRVLSVDEMAKLSSLPKSSVYRFVRVLREKGLLVEHSTGRYRLGYKFLEYANIVRADINITEIARPVMNDLTFEFGETTILNVLSGVHAVCLATSSPNHPIKVSSEEGKIMPLYCGGSSKSILAYQPEDLLDEIIDGGHVKKYTNKTLTEKADILADMKKIQERGFAYSNSEIDEGIVSYGFPIRHSTGEVFASLSVVGPEERMLKKDENKLVSRFKEAIKQIEMFL